MTDVLAGGNVATMAEAHAQSISTMLQDAAAALPLLAEFPVWRAMVKSQLDAILRAGSVDGILKRLAKVSNAVSAVAELPELEVGRGGVVARRPGFIRSSRGCTRSSAALSQKCSPSQSSTGWPPLLKMSRRRCRP